MGDRKKKIEQGGQAQVGADEKDWRHVAQQFEAFAGKDKSVNNTEWAKLCRDCKLIDGKKFRKEDLDTVFMKGSRKASEASVSRSSRMLCGSLRRKKVAR